jgi:hypothetical protein
VTEKFTQKYKEVRRLTPKLKTQFLLALGLGSLSISKASSALDVK